MSDEPLAAKKCGACLGVGCMHCGSTGLITQAKWQCKHFVSEWEDCGECIEAEKLAPLRTERDRYRTALESISKTGCMQSKDEEEFFCKHDGSAHSCYCPAGIAIEALDD